MARPTEQRTASVSPPAVSTTATRAFARPEPAPARRGQIKRRIRLRPTRILLFALLAILLGFLTLGPLAAVVIGSFRPDGLPFGEGWTFDNYIEVWSSHYSWVLAGNTLVFTAGSSAVAIVIALTLSWLIERTDLPGRALFRAAVLMPMATPPLLLAIAWALVLSPTIGIVPLALKPLIGAFPSWLDIYSLPGTIFVQGLAYVPTSILMLSPAIRAIDPSFEEAALVARATRVQVFFRVALPFLTPTLISIATILMMVGVLAFDVPAVIGIPGNVPLMSIEVFRRMTPPSGLPDYGGSAALNSAVFVLMVVGLVVYRRVTRHAGRYATVGGKAYRPRISKLGAWRWPALGLVGLYVAAAIVLPFLALFWASLIPYFGGFDASLLNRVSLGAYHDILTSHGVWTAAGNALAIAGLAVLALLVLGLVTGWAIVRAKSRAASLLLDVLSMIPMGVPPLMMGVALIFLAFGIRIVPIYGTIWLIALGHFVAFLPVSTRMMQVGLMQINGELEEAAAVAGANLVQTLLRIATPLLRPTMIALAIWVAVHSIREFSIAVMLQSGHNSVLSTVLYSFWETGSSSQAAALAVLLMAMLCLMVAVSAYLSRQKD